MFYPICLLMLLDIQYVSMMTMSFKRINIQTCPIVLPYLAAMKTDGQEAHLCCLTFYQMVGGGVLEKDERMLAKSTHDLLSVSLDCSLSSADVITTLALL